MNVNIINYTKDLEKTIALSGRLCYFSGGVEELEKTLNEDNIEKMIDKLKSSGHLSPFEHASFTFSLEGISRALTHQLVRHRVASYSQQSQRYVKETQFDYIIPKTIIEKGLEEKFNDRMKIIQEWYTETLQAGIPAEDARFYLPNATETKIIFTMNVRELFHFLGHRLCNRAQWEIREVCVEILRQLKEISPIVFKNIGANCVTNGVCSEGKLSCREDINGKN